MKSIRLTLWVAVCFLSIILLNDGIVSANPPNKPGNPDVPGLLAEVAEQNAHIVELNARIAEIYAHIAELNARIAELEAIIQNYEEFATVPQTGQTTSNETGDDGDM